MPNVSLKVTPGATVTDETNLDAAVLNSLGRPVVELLPNSIPADQLKLGELVTALLGSAGESFRQRNFLGRSNFWAEDWITPEGQVCPPEEDTENALDWWARPVGAEMSVARVVDGPDTQSNWAAQLTGGTGVTSVEFFTWVPSGVAGGLKGSRMTFSVYIKNQSAATAIVEGYISVATEVNTQLDVELADNGPAQGFTAGTWGRLQFTFDLSAYEKAVNGFRIGLRTTFLDSPLKSILVAQAQLEAAGSAGPFWRPGPLVLPSQQSGLYPVFDGPDKLEGARLVLQLAQSGDLRYLPVPPPQFVTPVLSWNRSGYPEWVDTGSAVEVFAYTGQDQFFTAPADAVALNFQIWGAGGSNDSAEVNGAVKGGVGGFTWGRVTVTPGNKFVAVVGEGRHGLARRAYGFGGAGQGAAHQHNGGGLSGIFTNAGASNTVVASTDMARAIAIAGGGGSGGQAGAARQAAQGGNGSDPASSGGGATLQGGDGYGSQYSGGGGGGGGYAGGAALALGGRGGTGFLVGTATAGAVMYSTRPSLLVPQSDREAYQAGIGGSGQHGLIVIEWEY